MDDPTSIQAQTAVATEPSPISSPSSLPPPFLFGPNGLRSGWRFLAYLALAAVVAMTLNFVLHRIIHHKLPNIWGQMLGEVVALAVAVVPALVMARIEKRPFGAYGLPRQGAFGKQFWVGALWGFAAVSLLLLAIRGVGDFTITGLALHGVRILKYGAFWAVLFLCVGFFEEFLTRGYTQFTLTQGLGFWPAAVLLSLAFGAMHLGNGGENRIGILAIVMIALFFCLTLRRTGTLWFAVGFHTSFDWGESYFYSVPDSGRLSPGHLPNSSFTGPRWITGGSDGPEGSVLVLVLIVLLCIVFNRVYPKVKYKG
jgi:membrane protease YdiL (CAAX protease family)